jgi:valine--pyruvate aminotransferase
MSGGNLKLSAHGNTMNRLTGVRAIMKDIQRTLSEASGKKFINLSAGNPLILPEVESLWRDSTKDLLASTEFGNVVGRYGSSRGYEPFIEAIGDDFNRRYGLKLKPENILVTSGSQSLYFFACNSFAGLSKEGVRKRVLLPLSPDYTGYGGVNLSDENILALRPKISSDSAKHRFKYHPDLSNLPINEDVNALLFSRPCNPTGNVITDGECDHLISRAQSAKVPVFIDSAYGPPFPALNFTPMELKFGSGVIHCMSFSKAGLPGERLGVAIGDAEILEVIECFATNANIHSSRYGQAIAARAIKNGRLAEISTTVIRPFYQGKIALVARTLDECMPDEVPWYLHQGEGAIFAWVWLENLPVSDVEFYNVLKDKGLIVVPGSSFFPGLPLEPDWRHRREVFRISLTATDEELIAGMEVFSRAVELIYATPLKDS